MIDIENSIDKSSFVPVYYQLAKFLEKKIINGELLPGDKIYSEAYFSKELGVSKMTVRKALEILTQKGMLSSEQGRGTFVSKLSLEDATIQIPDFSKEIKKKQLNLETKILEAKIMKPSQKLTEILQFDEQKVASIRFLRLTDKEPIAYERKYIKNGLQDEDLETLTEIKTLSFSELVRTVSGINPISSSVDIYATNVNVEEAKYLQVKEGTACLVIEQLMFSPEQEALAWGLTIYRGDKYKFSSHFSY